MQTTPESANVGSTHQSDQFPIGMVSLHFDDGYLSMLKEAIPKLNQAQLLSDQYLVSDYVSSNDCTHLHTQDMLDMQSAGHVIGGHSKSHKHLPTLSPDKLNEEVKGGRDALVTLGATPVLTFAYPFGEGATNDQVVQSVMNAGFIGARSTLDDFNTKTSAKFALKRMPADKKGRTFAEIKNWVDAAATQKTWLILVFHNIEDKDADYFTSPELLQQVIDYIAQEKSLGHILVVRTAEGIQMMNAP